jgi:hypothetical protein
MKITGIFSVLAIFGIATHLCSSVLGEIVEEFQVHGPNDFHKNAMDAFIELRRSDPNATLDTNGEFMKKANEYAIKRGRRKPDEQLKLKVSATLIQLYFALSY